MKINAKKSLGQNFLKSEKVLLEIVKTADLKNTDIVIEVGPGKGALTKHLINVAKKVVAIEKDHRLISFLNDLFKEEISEGKLEIIEGSVLDYDLRNVCSKEKSYKVVANIPYYITGKIIPYFLASNYQPMEMTLLVQKEVAERIVAKKEKESILSLSVKSYGIPKQAFVVDKKNFSPVPKVDSAVIKISNISKKYFNNDHELEKEFFRLLRIGFSSKRKKLTNNLKPFFGDNQKTKDALTKCGINIDARPENVALGEWKCLLENQ